MLAVKGERPATYEGNLLLDRLLGAEVRYLSDAEFEESGATLERWRRRCARAAGART